MELRESDRARGHENERAAAASPSASASPRGTAVTDKSTEERILDVHTWTDGLFSFRITRPARYRFEPGQFARLGVAGGGQGIIWRPYSIVSATYDEHLEFLSIVVPGGSFTTQLARMGSGDTIHLDKKPYGYLTASRFIDGNDLWLFASGTGVGPFLSMLRDPEVWSRFENIVLAYSVRTARDLAYRDEIVALARDGLFAENGHKLRFAPVITRERLPGTLGARLPELMENGKLETFVGLKMDPQRARVLLCGNPGLLEGMRHVLTGRGLRPDRSREPGHFATENYW